MKKLFLLIPTLLLTVALNAAVINITPTSPHSSNNLRQAIAEASTGDIIEMETGTYVETGNWIAFDDKEVTVRAAEGADVIIKPQFSVRVKAPNAAAKAEFIGVKFDCSALESSELFVPSDNKANQSVVLKNCELYDWSLNKALIHSTSARKLDVIDIDNCYFHGFEKSIVFVENASLVSLNITNSTFANVTGSITDDYYAAPIYVKATTGSVLVDHCTFYDVMPMSLSYGVISVDAISDVLVSNCIFARSSSADMCTSNLKVGGDVKNCLTYNYDNWQPYGHYNTATVTDCVKANPLFADAANGDFSLAGDWTTMSLSPARGAATDGSDLGDPRWYSAEVLPSTDFALSYVLTGDKAKLTGRVATDASNYLKFNNNKDVSQHGVAIWKVRATRSCNLQATLNIDAENTSGHRYQIEVFDSSNTLIGTAIGESANSWDKGDKVISDLIMLSEAGDYKIKLSNLCDDSGNLLHSITLSYVGGAVVPVSPTVNTTLNIADALFSGCSRDAIGIAYPSSETSSAWIKWNISTSATAFYDITVNINTTYAHGFTVAVYEDENAEPVASVTEGSYINTTGDGLALELGNISLAGGKNYVVKVTNAPSGSQAKVLNVTFAPVVPSSTITLPISTIDINDAIISANASKDGGELHFGEGKPGSYNPVGEWGQWEVTAAHTGTYLFMMGVNSTLEQSYRITILDNLNNVVATYDKNPGSGSKTLSHYFYMEAGTYFVKVENTHIWSDGYITSLGVEEPAILSLDQTATSAPEAVAAQNIQIIRTFVGGTYNTICLPFGVGSSKMREAFGSDVVLKKLNTAEFDEEASILDLNFEDESSSGIYQGTPYIIKPSQNIVNPVFENVEILSETHAGTTVRNKADFIGTFVATNVPAGENNLYLGPENSLYFSPDAATPIKGFRGWFVVHDIPGGAKMIKKARIVEGQNVITAIDLIKEENSKAQKVLRDGQLIIIRDGFEFTVQGQRIQ